MYKQSIFASLALAMLTTSSFANEVINKETTNLDEIVVTAKSDKSIDNISSSVTVITAEEISKMNATNIKDILVRQAGIIKTAAGAAMGGRESISIRGLDSTYTLFLIDGKRINPTDDYIGHSDFQYSWVPVDMIERIEIIKGAKSSIYGSQAIAGVINIITKKDTRKIYGEINAQAGFSSAQNGGDSKKINANIGGNISDKLFMFIGANKNERDATGGSGFTTFGMPTDKATYIEGLDTKDAIAKLKFKFDDTQSIYGSYIRGEEERRDYDNTLTYDLKRDIYSFGYEKSFQDVAFSIDYSRSESDSKANSLFATYTHTLENDNLKGEVKVTALKNNYIVIGAETSKDTYERIRLNGSAQYSFDNRANSYYIQDEIDLGDFIFTLGGRYDDNNKYGNEFSPNIGVVYKVDENQRLKANYGEAFKAPSVTKGSTGFGSGSHGAPYGNDNLKAETSQSYELAYEFYGEDTTFKAAVFKTDVEDMIQAQGTSPNVKYVNVGEAGTKGFEVSVDYDITENHLLNANYTYVKTENKQTGDNLTYKPENTFNIGLSSKFEAGISSYISANYVGEQYVDTTNKADGYTIFNAQIAKDITKDLIVRIGVDNITNEKFDDNDPYYLQQRVTYVGLNYKF
ncbi:TonB-dependent receptor plug domain-containing protein [Aliarcobacter skirrowii]|uniref:TonB-dependent receptor plug domain-containing protein n=1 Tax=Aliarcobacter skirrowii TaxID=28200 RepID=UPI0021B2D899|nr:TonB-dependent receptor [Aliarcobacter skirrowii]MCT7445822.1 TonB-dependent receptor [Aliarcobacter skirrowii]